MRSPEGGPCVTPEEKERTEKVLDKAKKARDHLLEATRLLKEAREIAAQGPRQLFVLRKVTLSISSVIDSVGYIGDVVRQCLSDLYDYDLRR